MKARKGLRLLAVAAAVSLAGNVLSGALPQVFQNVQTVYAEEEITLSQTEKSILVGDSFQLTISGVSDSKATYSWSSSASSVAKVNARGVVTGMALGTAVIDCKVTTSNKETKVVSCHVIVRTRVAATSVSIDNANYQIPNAHVMSVGDVYDFSAAVQPLDSTDKIFWEIANPSYAIVNANGTVAALRPGITRLIAYCGQSEALARNNEILDEIYIYIKDPANVPSVSPSPTPTQPPYIFSATATPTPVPTSTPTPVITQAVAEPIVPSITPVPASGVAEVSDVTLVSANTLQITFGKPVIANYVVNANGGLSNYISIAAGAASAPYGTLTGSLSKDQRVLTITAANKFDGIYVVMVQAGIMTVDGDKVARYVMTKNLKDNEGPKHLSTDVDNFGYLNTIKFDEPIDISQLELVGVASSCTNETIALLLDKSNYKLSEDKTSLLVNLNGIAPEDENKELSVGVNGIMDLSGNRTSPSVLTISLKTNTALRAPGAIVSVQRAGTYELKVTFDSPLFDAGRVTVGGSSIYGEVSLENECVGIYKLDNNMVKLTGNQVVGITGWYSYYAYGAVSNTVTRVVDFTVPATDPRLVGMKLQTTKEADTTELILEYDRDVHLANVSGVFMVSLRASNGDITTKSITYTGAEAGNKVTLTIYSGQMSASGTYTITLPGYFVQDNFDHYSTSTSFKLMLETVTDNSGKLAKPRAVEQDKENASVLYVKFAARVDEPSAITLTNYVLGNYVNPKKAELIEQGAGGATVRLTFEEGTIPYDAKYPIKISGVKGYNNTLAEMDVCEVEIELSENFAPIYASGYFDSGREIVLTFFESSSLCGDPDFNVYYNGKNIAEFSYIGPDNTVRIYLNTEITKGSVSVIATNANRIADVSGNIATLSGMYVITKK